jgi:transposase
MGVLVVGWIAGPVAERLPDAVRCVDPFHVVMLATDALDEKHGLSNARFEAINTQIRLITRRAFGFHSADALIALTMLTLADLCPPLPQ